VIGALHIVASFGAALCAVVAWYFAERPRDPLVRRACAALALCGVALGCAASSARHAALSRHSLSAAAFFERHVWAGAASLALCVALGLLRADTARRPKRALAVSAAVLATVALSCVALVHAYAPSATIE